MKIKKALTGALLTGFALTALTGCGNSDTAEVEKCFTQMEETLADAGETRELTQDEIDACNDPDQRAFILG